MHPHTCIHVRLSLLPAARTDNCASPNSNPTVQHAFRRSTVAFEVASWPLTLTLLFLIMLKMQRTLAEHAVTKRECSNGVVRNAAQQLKRNAMGMAAGCMRRRSQYLPYFSIYIPNASA